MMMPSSDQVDGLVLLLVQRLHVGVEQQQQLLGRAAVHELLEPVHQEHHRVVTFGDAGVLLEDGAGAGLREMRLERQHAFAPDQREQLEQQLE
jgi:hypothetical protein